MRNLGWAIYKGPKFDVSPLITLNRDGSDKLWRGVSGDPNRKWIDMMDITKKQISFIEPFSNYKQELLEFILKNILNCDGANYDCKYWTIMKNLGESEGQFPHTDYPLAHNSDYIKQQNRQENNFDKSDNMKSGEEIDSDHDCSTTSDEGNDDYTLTMKSIVEAQSYNHCNSNGKDDDDDMDIEDNDEYKDKEENDSEMSMMDMSMNLEDNDDDDDIEMNMMDVATNGDMNMMDMSTNNNDRPFFSPSSVSKEISNGSRTCVQACLDHMGFKGKIEDISPVGLRKEKIVQWSKVLELVCPGAVIQPCKALANLPYDKSDRLIVAAVNKKQGTCDHAMVVWKKDETQLGNKKLQLFNPGTIDGQTIRTVDLAIERTTAAWDMSCAAFLPGTVFEKDDEKDRAIINVIKNVRDDNKGGNANDNEMKMMEQKKEEIEATATSNNFIPSDSSRKRENEEAWATCTYPNGEDVDYTKIYERFKTFLQTHFHKKFGDINVNAVIDFFDPKNGYNFKFFFGNVKQLIECCGMKNENSDEFQLVTLYRQYFLLGQRFDNWLDIQQLYVRTENFHEKDQTSEKERVKLKENYFKYLNNTWEEEVMSQVSSYCISSFVS